MTINIYFLLLEGLDMRQLKRDVEYYTLRLNGLPLDERTKDLDLYKITKPSKFTQLCRQSLKVMDWM